MGLDALPLARLVSKLWGSAVRVTAGLPGRKAGPVRFWAEATQGLRLGLALWGQECIEMKIWFWLGLIPGQRPFLSRLPRSAS